MNHASVPKRFLRFCDLFNRGEYWESHEVLEDPWRVNASTFYKGLIIYASAFVHAQRGNPTGVRKQFAKAEGYLSDYAPAYMGVDVAALLRHQHDVLAWLNDNAGIRGDRLRDEVAYPRIDLDPKRIRGDEPELTDR